MKMIKNFMRGFSGGPDFTTQRAITFQFDALDLQVELPVSNIVTEEPPRDINFPFDRIGWFDENVKQRSQHRYVHIYTEIWYYQPPGMTLPDSEYGVLTCAIWLKRAPDTVNALDRQALADALIAEYDQHFNSPAIGGPGTHGLGCNTEIREEVAAQSAARATPFSDERYAEEVRLSIEASGAPPIAPAQVLSINSQDWVFYREDNPNPERSRSRQDFYCLPLNAQYFIQFGFWHQVQRSDKKAWQEHANQAQQRIMESVSVKRAP